MNKLPTISLKGKAYVQVKDRIMAFNETYPNGSIITQMIEAKDNLVTFKASCTPDNDKPHRYYTGHAFGTIDEVKAFEKLETVAVGRALAFMGIGIIDSVASADEMDRFEKKPAVKQGSNPNYSVKACGAYEYDMMQKTGTYTLDSGISKKTGKPFYIADFQDQRYWLTEDQHDKLQYSK